jgi:predicted Co/Zn/Cd cation transporter (cation efflux family)
MEFIIDKMPPTEDEVVREREYINKELKRIKSKDNIFTSILIIASSIIISFIVYWSTNNIKYAAMAAVIFPVIGTLLSIFGIITVTGFRSFASALIDLNHKLVALKPISKSDNDVILELSKKYNIVESYRKNIEELGREFVTGELAMFWEWDTSTKAKSEKAKDFIDRARQSVAT